MTAPQIQPMATRRLLRLAVWKVISDKVAGLASIQSPGNWATPPEKLPAVLVHVPNERKQSKQRGMPEFDTTCTVRIEGRIEAATPEAAQDQIEDLAYRVEEAILKGYWINAVVQQFASVTTALEVSSEGKRHIGGFRMDFECETFEEFDPTETYPAATTWPLSDPDIVPLDIADVQVDTVQPFDATGTYPTGEFPSVVTPAPRTSGPDGRLEAELQIPLT